MIRFTLLIIAALAFSAFAERVAANINHDLLVMR